MKKSIATLVAAALALCSLAQAADMQGRIDVDGTREGIVIAPGKAEGGYIGLAGWFKDAPEKNKQYLISQFKADSEWRKATMAFTPSKDGKVNISLKGAWDKEPLQQAWTLIDAVQAEGAEIKNGNFEDGMANWTVQPDKDGTKPTLSDISKSGSKSIKVNHNHPVYQELEVKGGQPVIISFWYKAAE